MQSAPGCSDSWGDAELYFRHCPYQVGQALWVREALLKREQSCGLPPVIAYRADLTPVMGEKTPECDANGRAIWPSKWQREVLPARFMPRWASRITLKVTDVRAERVQDITHEGAIAESVAGCSEFAALWGAINAKRGYAWESNPWVWVVSFERVTP